MDLVQTLLHSPAAVSWKKIEIRHHHGICVPLFSLHSQKSCGIGEYPDLLYLIPWCRDVGLDLLQLLPLNDTGRETSPYSALSSCALNPIHLGLAQLPYLEELPELSQEVCKMQEWNKMQRIDYPLVYHAKERFLQKYYLEVGKHLLASDAAQIFVAENATWLTGYAIYKAIKRRQKDKPWEEWDASFKEVTPEKIVRWQEEFKEQIFYDYLVQYLCFQQLIHVRQEASKSHVFLMGDLPILINRDSADVWLYRSSFNLDLAAGAPPDAYAAEGQNWGFPTPNGEVMEQNGYVWWGQRLTVAGNFYQLYRLDHVVGLFRLWSIPVGLPSDQGRFVPEDQNLWIPRGEKLLRFILEHSPLLPIGEDLGTIPPQVRATLNELGICGTKVMRWERYWDHGGAFIPIEQYSPISMTTVSTHDSEILEEWWKRHPEDARRFAEFKQWKYRPMLDPASQQAILYDSHHTASLFHINLLQEYLTLLPGLHWNSGEDERINVPGTISPRNWTYRFLPNLEQMVAHQGLRDLFKNLNLKTHLPHRE